MVVVVSSFFSFPLQLLLTSGIVIVVEIARAQYPHPSSCGWVGKAPFCGEAQCPNGFRRILRSATEKMDLEWKKGLVVVEATVPYTALGFGHSCHFGTEKAFCCAELQLSESNYTDNPLRCGWVGTGPYCAGKCPTGYAQQPEVAVSDGNCGRVAPRVRHLEGGFTHIEPGSPPSDCPGAPAMDNEGVFGLNQPTYSPIGFGYLCTTGKKVFCCENQLKYHG